MLVFGVHASLFSQALHWAKQFEGKNWDRGISIATDGHGHVYSIGNFQDTIDLDPGPAIFNLIPKGSQDIFISKLDASGNFIWAKQLGGLSWSECNALTLDSTGNVYITGSFLGRTDFDPSADTFNLSTGGDINAFICKLDSHGNFVWAKQIGATLAVNAYSSAVDDSGNVYTTGYFDGIADLDPGPGIYRSAVLGYSDIFIIKLNASGNFVWAKQMSGTWGEVGYAVAVDKSGNIYTTGVFTGTVDFDPGIGTFSLSTTGPGDTDIFLSKLDASGHFVWARQMAGEEARAMAIDNEGYVYIGGSGYNRWNSIAIDKFDPLGNNIWTKQIPASMCWSLATDSRNNVYTTGQFFGTKDFDPDSGTFNMTSIGNTDSYISKLDSAGSFVWAKQLGGTDQVWSQHLAVDRDNNVYTTGYFSGTADFDPGSATSNLNAINSYDVFVHKLLQSDKLETKEANLGPKIKIYPNPTNGKFNIELDRNTNGAALVLSDIMGQVIERRSVKNNDPVAIQIDGANGFYILEVYYPDGQKSVVRILKR